MTWGLVFEGSTPPEGYTGFVARNFTRIDPPNLLESEAEGIRHKPASC
jgi:hypothetical protein